MKVAFLGLGNMGSGIAGCILDAGHDLVVWNRSPQKTEPFVARGARVAATPREAVAEAEIAVTSLMDDSSVLALTQGADGLLAGLRPGAVHACVTTISPACADELEQRHAAHGSAYVSAPVVGRPDAAARGALASFIAGAADATARLEPLCTAYSQVVKVVSQRARDANVMKLVINYNVVSTIELISESYIFAEKCGLPLKPVRDFYQQLWFAHPAARLYADKLLARDFGGRGGFVMTGGLKDVKLMLGAAESAGTDLKIGRIAVDRLQKGVEAGMGEQDWSSFHELARTEAGLD